MTRALAHLQPVAGTGDLDLRVAEGAARDLLTALGVDVAAFEDVEPDPRRAPPAPAGQLALPL